MKFITVFAACALIASSAISQDDTAWQKKVTEAQTSEAMLALVREALPTNEVQASGTKHADQVNPEDNQPAPIVNFDVRLNEKTTFATNGTRLETSPAYYFVSQGKPYVVLGPRALNPRSPLFTRLTAAHELFHAKHHVGDPRPIVDRELETWTHVFVTYFHEVHPFKQRWAPLVGFYEDADPGERKATLDKIMSWYATPEGASVRVAFDDWLGRRRKDEKTAASRLVADLDKAIAAK